MPADVFPSSAELVVEAQDNCTGVTGEGISVMMCYRAIRRDPMHSVLIAEEATEVLTDEETL